jgi:hypothetical protein
MRQLHSFAQRFAKKQLNAEYTTSTQKKFVSGSYELKMWAASFKPGQSDLETDQPSSQTASTIVKKRTLADELKKPTTSVWLPASPETAEAVKQFSTYLGNIEKTSARNNPKLVTVEQTAQYIKGFLFKTKGLSDVEMAKAERAFATREANRPFSVCKVPSNIDILSEKIAADPKLSDKDKDRAKSLFDETAYRFYEKNLGGQSRS